MRHRVIDCDPKQRGFVMIERRWIVARSRIGGLLRDRDGRLDVLAARISYVAIMATGKAIINPTSTKEDKVKNHSSRL